MLSERKIYVKSLKRAGIGLIIIIVLIGIGLTVWEPLSIEQSAPPPEGDAQRFGKCAD